MSSRSPDHQLPPEASSWCPCGLPLPPNAVNSTTHGIWKVDLSSTQGRDGPASTVTNLQSASTLTNELPQGERQADDPINFPTANRSNGSTITDAESVQTIETVILRTLGTSDVAALILNKMIGTGIFTTPTLVLSLTGSTKISLILWAVGGIHAALCLSVYLEFGIALPFTGGELVYLDELFPVPELLATIIFSGFFLLLGNTAGNAMAFAKYILLAAEPSIERSTEIDQRNITFLAIVIISAVCLLHYFSSHFGLFLNRALALYKILLLLAIAVAGFIASRKPGYCGGEGDNKNIMTSAANNLSAFVYVLYSYQGWENANYVLGEIKAPRKTLRKGAFLAVAIVTFLYVLITSAMYLACGLGMATDLNTDIAFATHVAAQIFDDTTAIKVAIAFSALGNLIAVVFTASKVKQAIANQRIIPFYKFLKKNDAQFNTPVGGLVLHWIFTIIMIFITPSISETDGYNFVIGLFTYGHVIISSFVGIGALWIERRLSARLEGWQAAYIKASFIRKGLALLFVGLNIFVIVQSARADSPGRIRGYWWPATFGVVILGSCLYWAILRALMAPIPYYRTITGEPMKFGQVIGINAAVLYEDDEGYRNFQEDPSHAVLDESKRIVVYHIEKGKFYDKLTRLCYRCIAFLEKHLG